MNSNLCTPFKFVKFTCTSSSMREIRVVREIRVICEIRDNFLKHILSPFVYFFIILL